MLGLYSLGFIIVAIVVVIANNDSGTKKAMKLLALAPVLVYIAMSMKIVTPLTKFVMSNLQTMIGG